MSLLPAETAQYSAIIDGILNKGDLTTISRKQIMKELGTTLGKDISHQKVAVKGLILERFRIAETKAAEPEPSVETPTTNGHVKQEVSVKNESTPPSSRDVSTPSASVPKIEPESDSDEVSPPKKKRKQNKPVDDAKLAAMLQAQENRSQRATRGGANKKTPKKPAKKPRKKSEKKVKADDDSGLEEVGSDGEVKEKVKKGGFHKLYHLSAPLADLVGEATLSRPQVVKKIWVYIKERDLQDPNDKRQILCDEKMQLVFKQDKVHMFTMNKILGKQLYDVEEE
ncbi:related to UAF30-subunit of RNA polymerase I transcription factor [Phialocephala subalpina]|uniref:Related to UAF30-subunit of RNA polymerase I transcription factor n=1 Tax=Phialocephala subalpina TaxID=576137 RepID=A0A1L7WEP7_9HELO|nr:related to UAF30-subunit of RNA polymerase I transcription factor [Phialocephala subalpina]